MDLRVAQICADTFLTGAARRLSLLIEGLLATDVEPILIGTPSSRLAVFSDDHDVECHEVPMRGSADLPSLLSLRGILVDEEVDLVHIHGVRAAGLARAAAFMAGVPVVATFDRTPSLGWLGRIGVRSAVVTTPEARKAAQRVGMRGERLHAIPAPVDLERLNPRADRELVRSAEGARPDDVVILTLSAIEHGRGHDVLLRALARLSEAGIRPVLWMAADGSSLVELDRLRRQLGLAREAGFLGRRTDVGSLIQACDIVVDPGVVVRPALGVLEGMALGRPVIATEIGGPAESVVDGETGLLVPPGNPVALAEALRDLVVDGDLRRELGSRGPTRIAEGYLLDQVVDRHVELYADIVVDGGAGR